MPPKPPLTHFLCLPLANGSSRASIQNSLQSFALDVTSKDDPQNIISPKAIRPIGTIHLTLGVMSLQTQGRIDEATAFLHSLNLGDMLSTTSSLVEKPKVLQQKSVAVLPSKDIPIRSSKVLALKAVLEGLHPMQSPTATSILYASPRDSTSRLRTFCLALRQVFISAGFLVEETRPLLLHVTIVNTIYAKDRKPRGKGDGHGKKRKDAFAFDAREIIEKYRDYKWAEDVEIEKVSICEMGAKKIYANQQLVDEQYLEIASLSLPHDVVDLPTSIRIDWKRKRV